MIFSKVRRQNALPGGYFHLEEEKTKTRVAGFGHGDNIRLKDEYGNVWLGSAMRNPDNSVVYRFRNGKGKSLTGIADGEAVTLRDERGSTWKGFVG
ncbi:MAG: hypothetical protein ABI811_17935 [Acidobacteriota bacterium]